MSEEVSVVYHEVDFLLPVHRFNVRFSYVTKEGLPFIREFVLRLLHLSALTPLELATYFGLSKRETEEAISDLLDKGDLQFNDEGKVELTAQSKGYFSSLGATPQVSAVKEAGATLSFELAGFNCVGKDRSHENWNHGIKLNVNNEVIANSEKIASENFQKQFYQILEKKYISNITEAEGSERPRIYKMDSVTKIRQVPLRLSTHFSMDLDGIPLERDDFEILDDSEKTQELITSAISDYQRASNLTQIAKAMNTLGDDWTRKLFNNSSVDVRLLVSDRATAKLNDGKYLSFIGPVYTKSNWDLIHKSMSTALKNVSKPLNGNKPKTMWIAPSDAFWGKSLRLSSCFEDFISITKNIGLDQKLSNPVLYLPVQDKYDRKSISIWKRELNSVIDNLYGLQEGFLGGNVEIIIVENHFVVVCYHISRPESAPVSLPVGFISTDRGIVSKIQNIALEYIEGISSYDNPNVTGPLKDKLN